MEGAVKTDNAERVEAKRCMRDFQYSCFAKKCKVSRTLAEVFAFAIKLIGQACRCRSVGSNIAREILICSVLVKGKKAKEQLSSLQQKHNTLEGSLLP